MIAFVSNRLRIDVLSWPAGRLQDFARDLLDADRKLEALHRPKK
jgi:hypothetical protein